MTIGAKAVPPIPTPSERQCIHQKLDSTHERLDSCKRNIHRLQDRVDRLREIINRDSAQTLFRLNELRSNLDRVLRHLNMDWEDFQQTYDHDPDVSSFSTDSD